MADKTPEEAIIELDKALFGEPPFGGFGYGGQSFPFDISRPNIHDSKKDFQRELAAVKKTMKHCQEILRQYYGKKYEDDLKHSEMLDRLIDSVDHASRKRYANTSADSASDLIVKNISDDGLFVNSLLVIRDTLLAFFERYEELKDQEKEFWSLAHRAPNYYARTMALRFAKHYSMRTGKRPTFGTTTEGNDPSTDYGRALEQVFSILSIEADVRKSAEWALDQLPIEEPSPPKNEQIGDLYGIMLGNADDQPNDYVKGIERLYQKGNE